MYAESYKHVSDDGPLDKPRPVECVLDALQDSLTSDSPTAVSEQARTLADEADSEGLLGLQDLATLLQENLEALARDSAPPKTRQALVNEWCGHVRRYLRNPAQASYRQALLDHAAAPDWPCPLSADDKPVLDELLASPQGQPEKTVSADAEPVETMQVISPDLLQILRSEVEQLIETVDRTSVAEPVHNRSTCEASVEQLATRIECLGAAAMSANLRGVHDAAAFVNRNLHQIVALDTDASGRLSRWIGALLTYLIEPGKADAADELENVLQESGWPSPMSRAEARELRGFLDGVTVAAEMNDAAGKPPPQPCVEDVSLALPDDISRELLDALLQELPGQASAFSQCVDRLTRGDGGSEDVERAQRIAHTIKGAGNTVGVRGIATLMHHVEDILAGLHEHGKLPPPALLDVLRRAADCLEEMTEALLGVAPPPVDALQVLEAVVSWLERRESGSPPVVSTPAAPEPQRPISATAEDLDSSPEASVRVQGSNVDDALRLAGETLIYNTQLQDRIRRADGSLSMVAEHNGRLQNLVSELERYVELHDGDLHTPASAAAPTHFDPLELERFNELHTITHRLIEAAADAQEFSSEIGRRLREMRELAVQQEQMQREGHSLVMGMRMVAMDGVAPRLKRIVRQTCRATGKQVDLTLHGGETKIDAGILEMLIDPLMHVLRNAVDHGIEPTTERRRRGKPPTGRIELTCTREGSQIVIRCRDDGAGLDTDAIRQAALERGLFGRDDELTATELPRLIFQPGFSTCRRVSQVSGRGIGMNVLYSNVLALKGSVHVNSVPGEGCEFVLSVPVSLMFTHALLITLRDHTLAVSSRGIEQILMPGDGRLVEEDAEHFYEMEGRRYRLERIEDLLALAGDRRRRERSQRIALLVRDGGIATVVTVEAVLDSRDVIVKNPGRYLNKLRGLIGATIMGDGTVVPVVDLPELLLESVEAPREAAQEHTATDVQSPLPCALIVDDSISARRSLAQCIQDAGFEVRTAKDGLEALSLIDKKCPDILLVDLEMPRMNGLELTAHLRRQPATAGIPVIMVSSRATEKHRREADTAGVDTYLTKPFHEDTLMESIHRLLEPSRGEQRA